MYDKEELEKQSLKLIKKNKLSFIQEVIKYLEIPFDTFFILRLNESKKILNALEISRNGI